MIERGSALKRTNCFNKGLPRAKITYVNSVGASWFRVLASGKSGLPIWEQTVAQTLLGRHGQFFKGHAQYGTLNRLSANSIIL
jgi:hypothetical protein